MRVPRALGGVAAIALAAALVVPPNAPQTTDAASHREAPLISLDPSADISDFYMFRSYEPGKADKVVLIMDVIPGEEPSSGPNYFHFDPSVRYSFYIDNDMDGVADDIGFELRFRTEIRGTVAAADLFLGFLGRAPAFAPITALDGPGSEGIGLRQTYSVTMVQDGRREMIADGLIAVPSNVGPFTMPSYDALAAQGVHTLTNGVRVFAGQRQDPFYIDLGAVFDTLNFRRAVPALTAAEDENDDINPFGIDMLSGFNVHTIALEVPATLLTGGTGASRIGAYAATARQKVRVLREERHNEVHSGQFVQIQRLANPLVNEAIIGTEDKDRWNATDPADEAQFLDYYLNPRLALALEAIYGIPTGCTGFAASPPCAPSPTNPATFGNWNRTDLVNVLLKYQPSDTRLSELLRLDLSGPATPLAAQRRMGPLATPADPAAWPNGRRLKDDVTDIAVRVVGGPNYIGARVGDGVNADDVANDDTFPFIGTPWDGRDRQHENP